MHNKENKQKYTTLLYIFCPPLRYAAALAPKPNPHPDPVPNPNPNPNP